MTKYLNKPVRIYNDFDHMTTGFLVISFLLISISMTLQITGN